MIIQLKTTFPAPSLSKRQPTLRTQSCRCRSCPVPRLLHESQWLPAVCQEPQPSLQVVPAGDGEARAGRGECELAPALGYLLNIACAINVKGLKDIPNLALLLLWLQLLEGLGPQKVLRTLSRSVSQQLNNTTRHDKQHVASLTSSSVSNSFCEAGFCMMPNASTSACASNRLLANMAWMVSTSALAAATAKADTGASCKPGTCVPPTCVSTTASQPASQLSACLLLRPSLQFWRVRQHQRGRQP